MSLALANFFVVTEKWTNRQYEDTEAGVDANRVTLNILL